MRKALVITGVPGTGKSSVALRLSKIINGVYVNLSSFAIGSCLVDYYERLRDTYIVNEEMLSNRLRDLIMSSEKPVIIDTHYAEIIEKELVSKIFVLRLNPALLYRRLLNRKFWSMRKIAENILAEIDGSCSYSVRETFGYEWEGICEINVTNKSINEVLHEMLLVLHGLRNCNNRVIDWLKIGVPDDLLSFIIKHT